MKKIIATLGLLAAMAGSAGAQVQQEHLGLGIILGGPSGLSLKIPSGRGNSFNAILGYNANGNGWGNGWGNGCDDGPADDDDCFSDGSLYLGADYVWYNYDLIKVSQGRLPLYYGPGLNATLWDDGSRVGFRIVVGLEYQFASAPFDAFFELAPGINLIPDTHGYISAGIGTRFFF